MRKLLILLVTISAFAERAPIAPRPIVPAPYGVSAADTAYAGGRFLTAWVYHEGDGRNHIVGVFSDADGRLVSQSWFLLAPDVGWALPSFDLISLGDGFALLWTEYGREYEPHYVELDVQGNITRRTTLNIPSSRSCCHRYAWNGTYLLAISSRWPRSFATLFRRDGSLVRTNIVIPDEELSAAPAGDGFLVAGIVANQVHVMRIGPRAQDDSRRTTFGTGSNPVLGAARDGGAVVVWPRGEMLHAARLREDGTKISEHSIAAGFVLPLHVVQIGDDFLIIGRKQTLETYHLGADGTFRLHAVSPHTVAWDARSVAWSGRAALIGTHTYEGLASDIRTIAIRDGHDDASFVASRAPMRQSSPMIVATGGQYLVAWNDSSNAETLLRTAVVSRDGAAADASTIGDADITGQGFAWNGEEGLLAARDGDRHVLLRVRRDGTLVDAPPIVLSDALPDPYQPRASVIAAGNGWVVAWPDRGHLYTAEVSRAGVMSPERELVAEIDPPDYVAHREHFPVRGWLASNGRELLLVWIERFVANCEPCSGTDLVYAALLDANGQPVDHPLGFGFGRVAALAASDDTFMLASGENLIPLHTSGGMLRTGVWQTPIYHPGAYASDVVWDGGEFVAAVRYYTHKGHVAIARLDRNGNLTRPVVYAGAGRPDRDAMVSIAAERHMPALVAVHGVESDGDTARVMTIVEDEMQPLPPPPPSPTARAHWLSRDKLQVEWDTVAGDVDGYAITIPNSMYYYHTVSANTREYVLEGYQISGALVRAFNAGGMSEILPTTYSMRRMRGVR